jgi:hypothetical protein
MLKKKIRANLQRITELFTQNIFHKASQKYGFGIRKQHIPGTGSRIRNTGEQDQHCSNIQYTPNGTYLELLLTPPHVLFLPFRSLLSRRQLKLSVFSVIRDYEPVCAPRRSVQLHTNVIRIQMLSLCLFASLKLLTQKSFEKNSSQCFLMNFFAYYNFFQMPDCLTSDQSHTRIKNADASPIPE